MNPLEHRKTLIAIITIAFVSRTIYRFLAWRKKKLTTKLINEVITFSESAELIPSKYSVFRSKVSPSTDRMLYHLNQACYTLDICMYFMTSRELSYLIQKLHYRGVKVRYIVDADSAFVNKSETKRLYKQDAVVLRWTKSENIMHHKFCIIDASADIGDKKVVPFVMTGSLNWTTQGLSGNWESIVVMSEPKIVQLYKKEFEKLWLQFTPQYNNHSSKIHMCNFEKL